MLKRGKIDRKRSLDEGPLLSPPTTPSSEQPCNVPESPQMSPNVPETDSAKKKKIDSNQIKEIKQILKEDPRLLDRVSVPHMYRDEFKLEQLFKLDKTATPYVICSHPSCLKKELQDRVSRYTNFKPK